MVASDLLPPPKDESWTPEGTNRFAKGPRPRSVQAACALWLTILLMVSSVLVGGIWSPKSPRASGPVAPSAATFSFGAAGDYSFSADAQAVMTRMGASGLDFIIALGDFMYGDTTEQAWCNYFESQMGDGRVLLISGNHDEGGSDGDINVFRQYCNFGIAATPTGDYGKEYFFDYPASGPLVRFILSACGLGLDNTSWACAPGDQHYNFLSNAIDSAHAARIPWVITAMHKDCISDGDKSCQIGEAVQDLLLWKQVDLVLEGHQHAYLRSKRLTCATDDLYRPECIAAAGAWGQVIAIVGTGGKNHDSVGGTADAGYFETLNGDTFGFLRVDVSATALDAHFVPVVGNYTDAFQITRTSQPVDFTLSANPMSLSVAPSQVGFVSVGVDAPPGFARTVDVTLSTPAGVTGSCSPSNLQAPGTSTCVLSGSTPGSYDVLVTGTSGSTVRTQHIALFIASPSTGTDSTPPLVAIGSPGNNTMLRSGTVTVTGQASDDRGVQKVELSSDGVYWTPATGTETWSGSVTLFGGEQRIYARATDAAGNVGTSVVLVFVDVTAPPAPPSHLLGLPVPDAYVYAGIAISAVLAGGAAILRRAQRRRARRPPAR
jgi:hypothetical protein